MTSDEVCTLLMKEGTAFFDKHGKMPKAVHMNFDPASIGMANMVVWKLDNGTVETPITVNPNVPEGEVWLIEGGTDDSPTNV